MDSNCSFVGCCFLIFTRIEGGEGMTLLKKIKGLFKRKKDPIFKNGADISELRAMTEKETLSKSLSDNIALIREYQGNSFGLQVREFQIGPKNVRVAAVYIEGMVNSPILDEVLHALLIESSKFADLPENGKDMLPFARDKVIPAREVGNIEGLNELFDKMLLGDTIFLFEGTDQALAVDTKGWKTRAISESDAETAIRGPGKALSSPSTTTWPYPSPHPGAPALGGGLPIGSLTRTHVALVYIKGLAGEGDPAGSAQPPGKDRYRQDFGKRRVGSLYRRCAPFTVFPTILRTERPGPGGGSPAGGAGGPGDQRQPLRPGYAGDLFQHAPRPR
jgi:spore germination protein KA